MFTGIVEETGVVREIRPAKESIRLVVEMSVCAKGLKIGDSIAVNGCCLTAIKAETRGRKKRVHFDLLQETWKLTNLQFAEVGSLMNLERSLRADSRLGGHFVTGHIDGLGKITRWEQRGKDYFLEVSAPAKMLKTVIVKGSIAVDGISLTVAGVKARSFSIWIIPHTHEVTALKERSKGDAVNLETDMLGKYVAKLTGT